MITYKEFYYWLDGYLANKLESEKIEITPIVEKMSQVGDEITSFKDRVKVFNKHEPVVVNLNVSDLPPNITSTYDK
jgi:hypothetical protein